MGSRARTIGTFAKDARGLAAVEFAMVSPILIMLMFGAFALGHALFSIATIQWAVEDSVRGLMIDKSLTSAELEENIKEKLKNLTNLDVKIHYTEYRSGKIPVAQVFTDVVYPVAIPLVPSFDIGYRVETHVPRPF